MFCRTVQYYVEYEANHGVMTHGNHLFMAKTEMFMRDCKPNNRFKIV